MQASQPKKRPAIVTTPCNSSQLKAWGYDASTQTMQVDFLRGASCQYDNVPQAVADAMAKAESIGQYFGQHVRSKYKTTLMKDAK
jgi:hypothetical protein